VPAPWGSVPEPCRSRVGVARPVRRPGIEDLEVDTSERSAGACAAVPARLDVSPATAFAAWADRGR